MSLPQRCDHFVLLLLRKDGLEPQLGHALLAACLAECRARSLTTEKGPRALRVPGAVFVVADASGARLEESIAHRVEGFARHEHDELAVQVSVSICAFCSLPL